MFAGNSSYTLIWPSAAKGYAKIQTLFESCNSKKAKNASRAKRPLWPDMRASFTCPAGPSHFKQLLSHSGTTMRYESNTPTPNPHNSFTDCQPVGADFMSALLPGRITPHNSQNFPERVDTVVAIDIRVINILISLHSNYTMHENPYISTLVQIACLSCQNGALMKLYLYCI